jgi:pilus assembly protein CpaD
MRIPAALLVSSLLALGACATPEQAAKMPVLPSEHYAIEVTPAPQELKLAPHAGGLSNNQADALNAFVHDWMIAQGGEITLKAPEHGDSPDGAYRTVTAARDFLVAQGVAADKVRIVGYEAGADPHAPIVVGYLRYKANGPQCGRSWGDIANDNDNRAYPEFGCSITANVAAQIANPADLLAARASDPPDAERRQTVTDKYRQGGTTSTPADAQADGTFAKSQ